MIAEVNKSRSLTSTPLIPALLTYMIQSLFKKYIQTTCINSSKELIMTKKKLSSWLNGN